MSQTVTTNGSEKPTVSKEAILKRLRTTWGDMLGEEDAQLDVDIQLLTPYGQSGQPLLYDIHNRYHDELFTYTLVELPRQAEQQLGLASVTIEQAQTILRQMLVGNRVESDAETRLDAIIRAEDVGLTFGRNIPANGDPTFYPTSYREYYLCNLLLTHQNKLSGDNWQRLTASLFANDTLSLSFG